MNGRELSKAFLGDCPLSNEVPSPSSDDDEFESWAAIVAGCLQPAAFVPPVSLGLGTPELVAPEGWRPSVGTLTPSDVAAFAVTGSSVMGAGSATDDTLQRIQLRVNTKECGEVALVVERAEDGLRVLIAAVDGNAVTALHREALVMRRALESGGQSVASLKIVRMDQSGTELAKGGLTPSRHDRRRASKACGSGSKSNAAKRTPRRLLIIG